uniref:Uncharacterized protein n=1 Tax=Romanomermis culicivorax TaxID=13658 RepID=A0A915J837_ROMCU
MGAKVRQQSHFGAYNVGRQRRRDTMAYANKRIHFFGDFLVIRLRRHRGRTHGCVPLQQSLILVTLPRPCTKNLSKSRNLSRIYESCTHHFKIVELDLLVPSNAAFAETPTAASIIPK